MKTGHGLHHLLTQVDEVGVSGINGVEWDAVELPNQFMENFVLGIRRIGANVSHEENGAVLPKELFDKMHAAKTSNAVCSSSVKWNLPSSTWKSTIRKMKAV